MKVKSFSRWEKLRVKGKWNYILKWGVCGWGLTMAIGMTIGKYFFGTQNISIFDVLFSLIFYPLGGLVWGIFMWHFSEDLYKKHLKEKI